MSVWAAILAGGAGTRFWPLSTPERPKQLLPLAGDRPLLVQAVERLDGLVPPERILILTGPFLVDQVARVVPQIPRAQIFAEPRAASTAPAITWAAHWISQRDPGAQMLSLHADWAVRSEEHTSELQSQSNLVCRLLLEKKKKKQHETTQRLSTV